MRNLKTIFAIFRKEMRRIFTDFRMIAALFLPSIAIFLVYTIIGEISGSISIQKEPENYSFSVAYTNNSGAESLPKPLIAAKAAIVALENNNDIAFYPIPVSEVEEAKEKVTEGEYDVLVTFSDDFETNIQNGVSDVTNNIQAYYNGASEEATFLYAIVEMSVGTSYNNYLFNIEGGSPINPDLGTTNFTLNTILSFIFPMITISLLVTIVASITPGAVAGEKERGTMAALLMSPAKRSDIAIGKALALIVTSILAGSVSFIGVYLSIPKIMNGATIALTPAIITGFFFLIVTGLCFMVSLGLLISTFSKSTREANYYMGPMTGILIIFSILPSFMDVSSLAFSFIPFLNIPTAMSLIIQTGTIPVWNMLGTILTNVILTAILILLSARMFKSERIMFGR